MPIQCIEPRRLYRQIADQIRTLILAGEFPLAGRLPAERDLAKQLGVSRPSVREALIALEVEGLVEVRVGSGVYVRSRGVAANGNGGNGNGTGEGLEHANDAASAADVGPFELMRARYTIESECAALAAKSATRAQLDAIDEAIRAMESDFEQSRAPLDGDRLFHLRIVEATGNSALVAVVALLWQHRTGPLYRRLEHHYDRPGTWAIAMAEHRAVAKAIAERDAAVARAAMRRHLNQAYKRFARGWDEALETPLPSQSREGTVAGAQDQRSPARQTQTTTTRAAGAFETRRTA